MSFCPKCGYQLSDGMHFCPSCGAAADVIVEEAEAAPVVYQQSATPAVYQQAAAPVTYPASGTYSTANDYSLIFLSNGSCAQSTTIELMEDVLGYTAAQSRNYINNAPSEIAYQLTSQQAQYLAQMFTEYGIQVAVAQGDNYVDYSQAATSSVFDSNGRLLSGVAAVLGTITAINTVNRLRRWTYPDPYRYAFTPRLYRPMPPVHQRWSLFGGPRPAPRPAPGPRMPGRPGFSPMGPGRTGGPSGMPRNNPSRGGMGGPGRGPGMGGMGGPGRGPSGGRGPGGRGPGGR